MSNRGKPLVSVIIPLFNQKQYVGEAIESALNQTYPNIEVIVVNDGSTDNPFPVLEKYKKKIKVINQKNSGLAGARNTGIRHSSGEYIQFLDADDFLHKDKIRKQVEFSKIDDKRVSYCEIARYYNDSKCIQPRGVGEIKDIFPQYYNYWNLYPTPIHSLLFKKSIFERFGLFDEELKAAEDRHFLSKLAAAGVVFKYFPFIGGFYRLHEYSMNKQKLHILENTLVYYKKLNRELGDVYITEKFGYTGYQMMCANLTCLYLGGISSGMKKNELRTIKKIFKKEGIKIDVDAIPSKIKRLKMERLFLDSYVRRWVKYFRKSILR